MSLRKTQSKYSVATIVRCRKCGFCDRISSGIRMTCCKDSTRSPNKIIESETFPSGDILEININTHTGTIGNMPSASIYITAKRENCICTCLCLISCDFSSAVNDELRDSRNIAIYPTIMPNYCIFCQIMIEFLRYRLQTGTGRRCL